MEKPLTKFPFKNMHAMVTTVNKNSKAVDTFKIAQNGNSCLPDTIEIMKMVSYLTNTYGKLVSLNGTWKLRHSNTDYENPYRFRSNYLNELETILSSLLNDKLTTEEVNYTLPEGSGFNHSVSSSRR